MAAISATQTKMERKIAMKQLIPTCLALSLLITPFEAQSATNDPFALKVVRDGDTDLNCQQLVDEALLMRDIIQTTEDVKSDARLNGHAVTAAGAVGSFLIGTVTGGIGLAAAGFLVNQEVEEDAENADNVQDTATQRRALMVGIHKAKGCETSMEAAMIPIEKKSVMDISSERLASIEPAAGKQARTYNE